MGRGLLSLILIIAGVALWPAIGAVSPKEKEVWWSLEPLTKPQLPALEAQDAKWVRTPVDAFVIAKLREKGLSPSVEADRRTLIRRLSFDLLGLPPTPVDVEAFVADNGPKAYERLVDRLLASPHYGERWARHWLDVAHYGDTHGYDKDKPRPNAWPYRDYVIRAFNDDKPYGRFVCEQIAGDVMFPDASDGILATGFIAAGPWDFIGHAELPETKMDGQIARHLDRDDMVATTVNTFCSLTVQCAQCHDHKFDPISQRDYYGLQAVFAALDRADREYDDDPVVARTRTELQKTRRQLLDQKTTLEARITDLGGSDLAALSKQIKAHTDKNKSDQPEFGYHSQIETRADVAKWVQIDLGEPRRIERIVFVGAHDTFNNIGAGFGFPVRFKVEVATEPSFARAVVVLDHTQADYTNPGTDPQTVSLNGKTARYVRMTATKLAPRQSDYIFALGELSVFDDSGKNMALHAPVSSLDSIEAPPRWQKENLVDGYYYGVKRLAEDVELTELKAQRKALLDRVAPEPVAELAALEKRLEEIAARIAELPKPKIVFAGTVHHGSGNFRGTGPDGGKPRVIRVLDRGNITMPGEEVGPGAVESIGPLKGRFDLPAGHSEGVRRMELARWIVHPDNPLTWRSIVNRVWMYHFGRGIVDSPNDFGRMGQSPTHPELLNWMAVEFRDGGQSFKQLHRLILNSATYRQTSNVESHRGEKIDAENRLLWRMNRRRLEAEAIRDAVLAVSGRLEPRMFGPGFQDFVIEKPEHSPHYEYHLHDPEDPRSHRRSIYRFIVRSQPQPFLTTFDCADPSMQVEKRNETLTALQALALLNNRFMLAMAGHFAVRIQLECSGKSPESSAALVEDQVDRAFWIAMARAPTSEERQRLSGYASTHGLANTCRLLMNLNEFVFVD